MIGNIQIEAPFAIKAMMTITKRIGTADFPLRRSNVSVAGFLSDEFFGPDSILMVQNIVGRLVGTNGIC